MPFVKGKSGNPGGRKKGLRTVRGYLVKKYGPEARKLVDELDRIAFSALIPSKDRLPAVKELLARHSGQPPQSIDVTSDGKALPTIAVIELPAPK